MRGKIKKVLEVVSFIGTVIIGFAFIFAIAGLMALGFKTFLSRIDLRPADPETLPADIPTAGIGRTADSAEAGVYLGDCCREDPETAHRIQTYTEWEGVAPEWYRPWEPMDAEWEEPNPAGYGSNPAQTTENEPLEPRMTTSADHFRDAGNMVDANARQSDCYAIQRTDAGCPDWNLDSTLYGWDGHTMEALEMDVFSRVMYLEFWGTSPECCEAGADAILQLWDSGYYGGTMYGVLSAETETGGPVFETWDAVWGTEYDPDGLAEMWRLCEERFASGPEWIAPFFRTGHYHEWAVPCYEIDGVYFSTGKGWN